MTSPFSGSEVEGSTVQGSEVQGSEERVQSSEVQGSKVREEFKNDIHKVYGLTNYDKFTRKRFDGAN